MSARCPWWTPSKTPIATTDWDAVGTAIEALVARGDLEAAAALGRTAPYGEFDTQARAEVTAVRDTD